MQKEYLNLYNRQGKLLTEKGTRGEKSDNLKGISMIFIENSKGEFLLQKTSSSRGSVFATTGGHVSYGSNFLETIINEVKEELGIDIDKEKIVQTYSYVWEYYFQQVFYLKQDININNITIQKSEVDYVEWLTKDEINKLINDGNFREGNIEGYKYITTKF